MKVLVIGGTQFIGRHLVERLLANGHETTIFHRGKTNVGLFPGAKEVLGDRNAGFRGLDGQKFDVVVDTCAYLPSQARLAVKAYQGRVEHYVNVSTISVFEPVAGARTDEDAPKRSPMMEDDEINGETYGPLKYGCEVVFDEEWKGKLTHIRPGVVLGPYDPTDRFTYWPLRFSMGGKVLVPDAMDEVVTGIDVRDLTDFMMVAVEKTLTGPYNCDSDHLTFGDVISASERFAAGGTTTVKVPVDKLEPYAKPFVDIPIWTGGFKIDTDPTKAMGEGLKFRSIDDTAKATLDWAQSIGKTIPLKSGWDMEREAVVLAELGM